MYLGFKIEGIPKWVWFKESMVLEEGGKLKGTEGWMKNDSDAMTTICSLDVPVAMIKGRITSEGLGI
jgi:hypothetical protein